MFTVGVYYHLTTEDASEVTPSSHSTRIAAAVEDLRSSSPDAHAARSSRDQRSSFPMSRFRAAQVALAQPRHSAAPEACYRKPSKVIASFADSHVVPVIGSGGSWLT